MPGIDSTPPFTKMLARVKLVICAVLSIAPLMTLMVTRSRLVKLLEQPALIAGLAPLIQQEVILRLLTGPHGPQLRRLVTARSPSQQVAKAVAWLKQNFTQALDGDELADRAHMSPSTFRQHFRALTGVKPLPPRDTTRAAADSLAARGAVGAKP